MSPTFDTIVCRSAFVVCVGAAAMFFGVACQSDPTGPNGREAAIVVKSEWVTGAAAAALDSSGSFVYPPAAFSFISPARADSVSRAVLAFLIDVSGPTDTDGVLATDRGGPVHLSSLRPCERLTYVPNAVGPLPPAVDSSTRRFLGAHHVRAMCNSGGETELSIEIADAPSSIAIASGQFVGLWSRNSEWNFHAVPRSPLDRGLPVSPEMAVALVAQMTGVRITAPPDPLQAYGGTIMAAYPALCMIWHVSLERPMQFRGATTMYVTTDVYVRREGACGNGSLALWAASDSQPARVAVPIRLSLGAPVTDSVSLSIRFPIRFEKIVPVP